MFDLSSYSFSPYALPVLVVGATSACLGLVTVIRERGSPVSLAFCAMTWSVAIWLLSFGPVYSAHDSSVALAWVRVEHLGVVFIPSTVFYFTLAVVGRLREMRRFAWVSFALSGLFYLGVVSTDWFVIGVHRDFWGYYPTYGPLSVPFLAFFLGLMVSSFGLYWVGQRRTASGIHQQRLKAIMLALGVAYLASMDYLGGFNMPVYPAGYLFIAAFVVMVAWAIRRYRLLDITPAFAAKEINDTMADALLVLDREGVIRVANRAAGELFGCAKQELIGRAGATIDATLFSDQHLEHLIEAGTPRYYEAPYERTEGDMRILGVSASVMRDRRGEPVATVCIAHDITDRKRAEALLAAQKQVLEMVAAGAPLPAVLDTLARNVEAQSEGLLCSILLLDRDGVHLRDGSGPSLPDSYRQAVDGIAIGSSAGSCGTAAYRREAVIVTDVATDPLWADYRDLALSHGLRACWSTPILLSGGEVLGTFAMYYRQPRAPDQRDLELIERATHIAGIAIERRRAEEALRESEETYRELFENANDIVYTHDLTGRFTSINRAAEQVTGYSRQEAANMNVAQIVAPEHLKQAMENIRRKVEEGGATTYELEIIAKDGRRIPLEVSTRLIYREGNPVGVQGVARDISERKRAEETIRHLAYHDALTGLPNRALFKDRLNVALAQARRNKQMLAVMFLDLDRFKDVNDTVGHAEGDQLLRRVSELLTGLMREGDTVARVGGDEFTLLLPSIARLEDAVQIAERILERLRRPQMFSGHEFHVTTSLGITIYPADGEDTETLLRNADTAMYRAKEQGRNNYQLYTPAMNASILERLALESSLRHALQRDEFVLHYQPQFDVRSGRIVGVEALVRWQHPERALVLPGEFIPLAEETGLIIPLGEWVLRTACAQNRAWQEAGLPPLRVAVNLSGRQFQQPDLVQTVARVLKETGLDPHFLDLEITESAATRNSDFTIMVLRELREMGVRISVDDFGAGYSSLSYLKDFPIHTLKIDRSFVRDLTTDPNDAAIVSAIIALAHSLSLNVVAEGVETEEQLAFLKERQCDEFQGFLLARPMPAQALERMLSRSRRARPARVS